MRVYYIWLFSLSNRKQIKDVGVVDVHKALKEAANSSSSESSSLSDVVKPRKICLNRSLETKTSSTPSSLDMSQINGPVGGACVVKKTPTNSRSVAGKASVPCGDSFFEDQSHESCPKDRRSSLTAKSLGSVLGTNVEGGVLDSSSVCGWRSALTSLSNHTHSDRGSYFINSPGSTCGGPAADKILDKSIQDLKNLNNSCQSASSIEDRDYDDEMEVALAYDDFDELYDSVGNNDSQTLNNTFAKTHRENNRNTGEDSNNQMWPGNQTKNNVSSFVSDTDEKEPLYNKEASTKDKRDFRLGLDSQTGITDSKPTRDCKTAEGILWYLYYLFCSFNFIHVQLWLQTESLYSFL